MKKKTNERQKLMANKTTSKIPKTPTQKKRWIRARQIVTKESDAKSEKDMPWGLVTKIYKNQNKAGKTAKKADVKKAKVSKAVKKYKKPDEKRKKK